MAKNLRWASARAPFGSSVQAEAASEGRVSSTLSHLAKRSTRRVFISLTEQVDRDDADGVEPVVSELPQPRHLTVIGIREPDAEQLVTARKKNAVERFAESETGRTEKDEADAASRTRVRPSCNLESTSPRLKLSRCQRTRLCPNMQPGVGSQGTIDSDVELEQRRVGEDSEPVRSETVFRERFDQTVPPAERRVRSFHAIEPSVRRADSGPCDRFFHFDREERLRDERVVLAEFAQQFQVERGSECRERPRHDPFGRDLVVVRIRRRFRVVLLGRDDRETARLLERVECDKDVPEASTLFCFDDVRDPCLGRIAVLSIRRSDKSA